MVKPGCSDDIVLLVHLFIFCLVIMFAGLHMNLPRKSFIAYRRILHALFFIRAPDITPIYFSIEIDPIL